MLDRRVSIELSRPDVASLSEVLRSLGSWQRDRSPMQLHPGDLGWQWRFGADNVAELVRVWRDRGEIRAVGFLDGEDLLRMAVSPAHQSDSALVSRIVADLAQILPGEVATVEARCGEVLTRALADEGWVPDEPWTPLERNLAEAVPDSGLRIEVTDAGGAEERTAVHRASFVGSSFTAERWHTMADGPAYADARCLVAFDEAGAAVAAASVWSAGAGRPGLLEPVGVHQDHRRLGYGAAISLAAAAALRDLGSSSAVVCTPSSNVGAVATYVAAGFEPFPEERDLRRT